MSKNVKEELGGFKQKKTREMREALQGVVNANIEQQQKVTSFWRSLTVLERGSLEGIAQRVGRLQ